MQTEAVASVFCILNFIHRICISKRDRYLRCGNLSESKYTSAYHGFFASDCNYEKQGLSQKSSNELGGPFGRQSLKVSGRGNWEVQRVVCVSFTNYSSYRPKNEICNAHLDI